MFALHVLEEGGLGGEEALLQLLLQAAGPAAHAAVHRHLAERDRPGPQRTGWAARGCARGCGARSRSPSPALRRELGAAGHSGARCLGTSPLPRGAPAAGDLLCSWRTHRLSSCKHRSDLPRSPARLASAVSGCHVLGARGLPPPGAQSAIATPPPPARPLPAPFLPGTAGRFGSHFLSQGSSKRRSAVTGPLPPLRLSTPSVPLDPGASGLRAPQVGLACKGETDQEGPQAVNSLCPLFSLQQTVHAHHP